MATPKGYFGSEKDDRTTAQHVTVSPSGSQKVCLDVRDMGTVWSAGTDAAEAGSTTSVINATGHIAIVGDRIRFTTGALTGLEFDIMAVTANTMTTAQTMSVAPAATDDFVILKSVSLTLTSGGGFAATTAFTLDGGTQEVIEDTGTPANNRPLPVKMVGFDGDVTINSANLDLGVQLSHLGANADVVRVGDGVEEWAINAANEGLVKDTDATALLTTIDVDTGNIATDSAVIAGDTTSLDTKLPAQGAAVTAASTPVNIASDQIVPVSATDLDIRDLSHTQDSVVIGDGVRTALVTGSQELAVRDSDANTELDSIDTRLGTIAGAVSGSEMQVDVVAPLPAGTNVIGEVGIDHLTVVDMQDDAIIDATDINGSAGALYNIVTLAADVKKIQIMDTSGVFMGVYDDTVKVAQFGPGSDSTVEISMASGSVVALKALGTAAPTAGEIAINFLG